LVGQRNERKKWIHCFEGVTAVIFVAAISEYDQVLYEDEGTHRMTEALNLFEEVCNSKWFRKTALILFLNKCDLFAQKLETKTISVCFPDYVGDNSYSDCCQFIRAKFEARNRQIDKDFPENSKKIYSHITCATDTSNVKAVFNAVKDIVIRDALKAAGLT